MPINLNHEQEKLAENLHKAALLEDWGFLELMLVREDYKEIWEDTVPKTRFFVNSTKLVVWVRDPKLSRTLNSPRILSKYEKSQLEIMLKDRKLPVYLFEAESEPEIKEIIWDIVQKGDRWYLPKSVFVKYLERKIQYYGYKGEDVFRYLVQDMKK